MAGEDRGEGDAGTKQVWVGYGVRHRGGLGSDSGCYERGYILTATAPHDLLHLVGARSS